MDNRNKYKNLLNLSNKWAQETERYLNQYEHLLVIKTDSRGASVALELAKDARKRSGEYLTLAQKALINNARGQS